MQVVMVADHRVGRERRMQRSVLTSCRLQDEEARRGGFRVKRWFLTLTYRPGVEWAAGDIKRAQNRYSEWCRRRGVACRIVWKAELQQRGAVHYHAIAWLPVKLSMPKWDKQGWWLNGMTQRVEAFAPTKYLSKYTSKGLGDSGVAMPRGARCFGARGLSSSGKAVVRFWNFPGYVRERWGEGALDAKRCAGGFVNVTTGQFLESQFLYLSSCRGRSAFVRKSLADFVTFSWSPVIAVAGSGLSSAME